MIELQVTLGNYWSTKKQDQIQDYGSKYSMFEREIESISPVILHINFQTS